MRYGAVILLFLALPLAVLVLGLALGLATSRLVLRRGAMRKASRPPADSAAVIDGEFVVIAVRPLAQPRRPNSFSMSASRSST